MPTRDAQVRGYASTSRGQIHYAEAGTGPPLILLSESPRTHRQFQRVLPLLAPHYRVIAIDTPGYGNSDPAPDPLTVPAVAECIVDFLDELGLHRPNVFGINTGNKIGAALGARWPDRIDRLVLAGYTHSIIPEWAARNEAIRPFFDSYRPLYEPSADGSHLVRAWTAAHATASRAWWPPKLLMGRDIEPTDVEDAEAVVIDYLLGWRHTVSMYQAIWDFDLEDAFERIEAPTLVLELTTPQEKHYGAQAERVCKLMKRATPASVPVTLGSALQTEAAAVVEPVLAFLRSAAVEPR